MSLRSHLGTKANTSRFLVERIILLNAFGCPLSSRESHIGCIKRDDDTANRQFHSSGVWSMASYINHSCLSNARRSFIGDMMIVRASRDLPPNTEITFWYKSPMSRDPKEFPVNLQHWGFKCDCILCQETRSTSSSVLSNRTRISADLRRLFKTSRMNLRKIEDRISNLASTYSRPASEVPHLTLDMPYLSLAAIYASSRKQEKSVEFGLKALESLGFVIEGGNLPHVSNAPLVVKKWGLMDVGVVGCWMILFFAYRELAPTLASQAEGYARVSYKICVGEDETFDKTYSSLSDRADGFLTTAK
jgi:SET domain.